MREILSGALLLVGTTFMFLAAVGLVRQPDIYLRMSATSKARPRAARWRTRNTRRA